MRATIERICALSHAAMDVPITGRAALSVEVAADDGVVPGAFQRSGDAAGARHRRVSGGSALRVAAGSVHVVLALPACDALVACEPPQLINRHVRPLLRALSRHAALAHYFGRDWISVLRRPAAFAGFAHDAGSGRAAFEAFVPVHAPLWIAARASFGGKEPASLDELSGRVVDAESLASAIRSAYGAAYGPLDTLSAFGPSPALASEPPWTARVSEAIGEVCAGRSHAGGLCVGGEFMGSRDALAALETRLAILDVECTNDAISQAIDETLRGAAVLFGVRDRASIRDAVVAARR